MRWLWIVLGGVAVIAVYILGVGLGNTPGSEARARERTAIGLCWQDHERKSLTPEARRLVASTCEQLERKFYEKHGVTP